MKELVVETLEVSSRLRNETVVSATRVNTVSVFVLEKFSL